MKVRLVILIAALLLPFLLLLSSSTTAQNQSSCVTCHTDEAMLKKTCKPFVMPEGEGEG
jgi:hypothetical protein